MHQGVFLFSKHVHVLYQVRNFRSALLREIYLPSDMKAKPDLSLEWDEPW